MKVVEYNSYSDIVIEFDQGNKIKTSWNVFCKGEIKNPYDRATCGVGFLGEGKYKTKENGKHTPHYIIWNHVLQRCYNENVHKKQPTYKGCNVAEEWFNYQNFASWYDQNYYQIEGQRMNLDKDILVKGNKFYSPETCVFVPQNINKLFIKSNKSRGELPLGVSFEKSSNKYIATCNNHDGSRKKIGRYNSPEEAFIAYKECKENLIKKVAEIYKTKIPFNLYRAMITYKVEISD